MKHAFLIAAPQSGSGKTTIARGLMALLRDEGYTVQPFKCGPDYIDTKFHAAVCGRPSVNLDTFMATPDHVRRLFAHYGADADVAVVEGMMGLYDGYDRHRGSTYEIAAVLGVPVVLVVDARSAAYSVAALLRGFLTFRDDLRVAGVIFNRVGSPRHRRLLQQVCDDLQVRCLGCVPRRPELEQASRYLGLDFSSLPESRMLVDTLAAEVDWRSLLAQFSPPPGENFSTPWRNFLHPLEKTSPPPGENALVALNGESFSFVYQETLDGFAHVRRFDPERDVPSFQGVDLLYLPGGYPEKHLEALVRNEACRHAIREYAEAGGRVIAECGGMMYLCQSIIGDDGEHPMCGVLPYRITARREDHRLSLGYRRFRLDGREYRGHEFHYTQLLPTPDLKAGDVQSPASAAQVYNAVGEPVATPVFRYKNVLASYTHLYAGFALKDDAGFALNDKGQRPNDKG